MRFPIATLLEGGPGSGHHGHKGLKGVWGGSSSDGSGGNRQAGVGFAKAREKYIVKEVDSVVRKYLKKFGDEIRPESPPIKNVVFRVMNKQEWEGVLKNKKSGNFWSSDPTEYGRHSLGNFGRAATNVFVAAKFDPKEGKIYRGIVLSPAQARRAHFNSRKSKGVDEILSAYWWDGQKLTLIYSKTQGSIKLLEGGPGSGHHGHKGLKGVWGGSSSDGSGGKQGRGVHFLKMPWGETVEYKIPKGGTKQIRAVKKDIDSFLKNELLPKKFTKGIKFGFPYEPLDAYRQFGHSGVGVSNSRAYYQKSEKLIVFMVKHVHRLPVDEYELDSLQKIFRHEVGHHVFFQEKSEYRTAFEALYRKCRGMADDDKNSGGRSEHRFFPTPYSKQDSGEFHSELFALYFSTGRQATWAMKALHPDIKKVLDKMWKKDRDAHFGATEGILEGGPGSGHHGHKGLKGVWGGSSSDGSSGKRGFEYLTFGKDFADRGTGALLTDKGEPIGGGRDREVMQKIAEVLSKLPKSHYETAWFDLVKDEKEAAKRYGGEEHSMRLWAAFYDKAARAVVLFSGRNSLEGDGPGTVGWNVRHEVGHHFWKGMKADYKSDFISLFKELRREDAGKAEQPFFPTPYSWRNALEFHSELYALYFSDSSVREADKFAWMDKRTRKIMDKWWKSLRDGVK